MTARVDFKMELTCIALFVCGLCFAFVNCKSDDNAATVTINGKALYDMGKKYNKPLLSLIGKSLMDLERCSRPCSEWTEWSVCELFVGQFGMKKRTRQCGGGGNNGCRLDTDPRNDTETVVCQRSCLDGYERAQEGCCVKFYNATKKNHADAETSCGNDGGHLININSQKKWTAFVSLLEKYKHTDYVHIDGQRKDPNSPWTFNYESDVTGYTNWAPGQPSSTSSELCLFAINLPSNEGLHDGTCSIAKYYVCEIVPTL